MTNIEIAQLISERIGQSPIPHNDIRNISYEIYQELGGESELEDFEDIYELLLTILPMAREGGVGIIDDTSIRIDKTWSSNKINSELLNHYTKIETDTLLGGKQNTLIAGQNIVITNNTISAVIDAGFSVEVVQTLPTTGEVNTIYFVPKQGSANPDVYDEYMYINNTWEKIGSTEVDLSNYYNKTEVNTLLSGKQATIIASDNIDITNNAIKAVGYRYNTSNGVFAEGDRDIVDGGTTYFKSTATGLMSHAEGSNCTASGRASHVEGNSNIASGIQAHSEGSSTEAKGTNSHTEGRLSVANGYASHAEGDGAETGGNYASATTNTKTVDSRTASAGDYAHAEGLATIAYGIASHAEGQKTFAKGTNSHAEGNETISNGVNSHTEGRLTKTNESASNSHTEGYLTETGGNYTSNTKTAGVATDAGAYSHAEGNATIAQGHSSHAEGYKTLAKGNISHTEGTVTLANGLASHTEGALTETGGAYAYATTNPKTAASNIDAGSYAHAEGNACIAYGNSSHAEGRLTLAKGNVSHAEGNTTIANGVNSHAEGINTIASGNNSHSEGSSTTATGNNSHAEGASTVPNGNNSHAEGRFTKTLCNAEHAQGSYNVSHHASDSFDSNVGNTLHSIGNGTAENNRKNVIEVMQSGQVYLLGVGNYDGIHIKGETGAPSGLQTLQEVVRGLKNISITLSDNTTKTYQAKEGMTWFDWVNSDLNTDGFVYKKFSGEGFLGYAIFEGANSEYHLGAIFNGVGGGDYVPAACTISTSLSYYFYD